jgi:hypothetical protein
MGVFGHVIKSTRSEEKVSQSMTNKRSAFQKYLNSHLEPMQHRMEDFWFRFGDVAVFGFI